ncbi:MAG: hypothetical protein GX922_04965 [Firmicutes bacterium]|nr:hypothetical protein [Bacillota bacterium]
MYYCVTKEMIRAKTTFHGLPVPAAIALICPHCHDYLTYFCHDYSRHTPTNSITFCGSCPACEGKTSFWLVNCRDYERSKIFMYPPPARVRAAMQDLAYVPHQISENYLEALATYHHNYYKATTTMVRASLEDVFKTVLGEGEITELADLITQLADKTDLTGKMKNVSTALADNKQLMHYFDFAQSPTRQTAATLLTLLEFVLTYTYVVPAKIHSLQQEISSLEQE